MVHNIALKNKTKPQLKSRTFNVKYSYFYINILFIMWATCIHGQNVVWKYYSDSV